MGSGRKQAQGLLCVCQICICGRHRCIHHPKFDSKPKGPCVLTEYKDTYRQFPSYEPIRSLKPDSATKLSDQPFRADTSYKQDFIPHLLAPRSKREQPKYVKPIGKVNDTSSYQNDYVEKFIAKMPSAKPPYRPSTGDRPFTDTTVHRETYRPWEVQMSRGMQPKPSIKLPTGKFYHQTTFQDDFQRHTGHPGREAIRVPDTALSVGAGKFADETTTRRDYAPKSAVLQKSAKPMQNIMRYPDPFDHNTTCQNTYKWPNGRPASSCKPMEMTYISNEPLGCDTTHNMTYKQWNVPKRLGVKPRKGWEAPVDPFDHKTTVQHDYSGKSAEPAKSAKPDYHKIHPGMFDGLTTHKNEFKSWEVKPRESFRPAYTYKSTNEKFNGQTTFQHDFKGSSSSRPDLCIPKEGGFTFNGDQNFRTMYRDTYLGDRPPSCPVKFLEFKKDAASVNGYVYKLDQNGHQFFSPNTVNKHIPEFAAPAGDIVEVLG